MHICYIDDSGDERTRIYCALAVPVEEWHNILGEIKKFRRQLKAKEGVFVTMELHARDFVAGRGRISKKTIFKRVRCRIFEETLEFIAGLTGVKLFNAFASSKKNETMIFERLLNRINSTMKSWGSKALVISDEGKDYTSLVRRMGVYNPIPSRYGRWPDGNPTKNIPLTHIVEDLVFRDSETSQFIQMSDFCAYALFRSERPLESRSRYGLDASFSLLTEICTPECFSGDPKKLGIIRDT
jgi:Protein of unknown function (DUF3800)